MRLRFWIMFTIVLLSLSGCAAIADTVLYDDTCYVFPAPTTPQNTLTVSVEGLSYAADTLEPIREAGLSGAVFAFYIQDESGHYNPLPDPANPAAALTIVTGDSPVSVALPHGIMIYIRQETAPQGYAVDPGAAEYNAVTLPATLSYTNRKLDVQGIRIALSGVDMTGETPLPAIAFSLISPQKTYDLITDENGIATLSGIDPGTYTLRQETCAAGYRMDTPELSLTISQYEPLQLELHNTKDGSLSLRVLGLSLDSDRCTRLIPIERRYDVYDTEGVLAGTITAGEMLSLPATPKGIAYTLRAAQSTDDGYGEDAQSHTVTLFSGSMATCQVAVQSTKGFFAFTHQSSADSAAVAGGIFAVIDDAGNTVLAFEAAPDGSYASQVPLPAGHYTLRMQKAADGYLFSNAEVPLSIEPFLSEGNPQAQVAFESVPLPASLLSPQVSTTLGQHASLFEQDADISFVFALQNDEPSVTLSNLRYSFDIPSVAGLEVLRQDNDGAALRIARRFALAGVEEIRQLDITGTVSYTIAYPSDADGTQATLPVSAPFEATVAQFAAGNDPDYAVSGHVYYADGSPATGIRATLGGEETITDPFGAFAFEAQPQGQSVYLAPPSGYGVRWQGIDAQILPLRSISGRVETYGNLDGYPVTLSIGDEPAFVPDAQGFFAVTGIFAPEETLAVTVPQGVRYRVDTFTDEAVIHLYEAAVFSGNIRTPEGDPIANAEITLTGAQESRSAQSDSDGLYTIDNLFPGEYRLSVELPAGYVPVDLAVDTLSLSPGEIFDYDSIVAMRPATLEGALLEGDKPLEGVIVTLFPLEHQATTDAQGRFTFDGLIIGAYALRYALPPDAILLDTQDEIHITHSAQHIVTVVHTVRPASISGSLWRDDDDDGLLSSVEAGLSNASIALLDENDQVLSQAITLYDGTFTFTGLTPGRYRLAVTLPDGMIFSRSAPDTERIVVGVDDREGISVWYTLESGDHLEGLMAGAIRACTIEGTLFEDRNGNSAMDSEDPALDGFVVMLQHPDGSSRRAETNANGHYRFDNLRAGDYTLQFVLPEDAVFTTRGNDSEASHSVQSTLPRSDAQHAEYAVSLRRWRPDAVVNAGMLYKASILAQTWLDIEATGSNPGNAPFKDIQISLYQVAGDKKTLVQQALSDTEGALIFADLRPGTYLVQYRLPNAREWTFTSEVTDVQGDTGHSQPIVLTSGQAVQLPEVGMTQLGSIAGIAFEDGNYDGLREESDKGIYVNVTLSTASGRVIAQKRTDADGRYQFDGIQAGRYVLDFELPDGYRFTKHRIDAPSHNSDVPEVEGSFAQTETIYLPMGEALLVDVGAYRTASIQGTLWQDAQNSGLHSADNPPLPGFAVSLLDNDGTILQQTVTNANGAYAFVDLVPGTYSLQFTLVDGMLFGETREGSSRYARIHTVDTANGQTDAYALQSGQRLAEIDAGAIYTGSVQGKAINVKDGSGLQGVRVVLMRGDIFVMQTDTDASGEFLFEAIRPGVVSIHFETPSGWALVAGEVSDPTVRIPQGGASGPHEIRYLPEASILGKVWLDGNADGIWDASERPLSEAQVDLYRIVSGQSVHVTVTRTDVDGAYAFTQLLPDEYAVAITYPDGIEPYADTNGQAFSLAMGEVHDSNTPVFAASTIEGRVWEDRDDDGLFSNGDPTMAGIPVSLVNPDGLLIMHTETDEDGLYRFESVQPVTCQILFVLPDDYLFIAPVDSGSVLPLTDTSSTRTNPLEVSMGETITNMHAGVQRRTRIGDLVWLDINGNGLQDTGEPGVEGITVRLWQPNQPDQSPLQETRTDANGRYRFDALRPGYYVVSFEIGDTYLPTLPVEGLNEVNSKLPWRAETPLRTEPFMAQSGKHMLSIDAGVVTRDMADSFGWVFEDGGVIELP